jgi:crotonobetainyl-CoA:carnitine CoA-transferase CaiB-like acyl-CoA transferase
MNLAMHAQEGIAILDEIFATRTYDEWREVLRDVKGVWSPVQQGLDLHTDPQAVANGYIAQVEMPSGASYPLVANPTQFDETPNEVTRAPQLGEHTDDVLRTLGYDDEEIINLKLADAIL